MRVVKRDELDQVHFLKYGPVELMELILEQLQLENLEVNKFEADLIKQITISLKDIFSKSFNYAKTISDYNNFVPVDFGKSIESTVSRFPINESNLIFTLNLLCSRLARTHDVEIQRCDLLINDTLINLVFGMSLRNDNLFRKITGNWEEEQQELFQRLITIEIQRHPYFTARGAAFFLLMMLNNPKVEYIMIGMDALLDEALVNDYAIKALPYVRFRNADLIERLIGQLSSKSVVRIYAAITMLTNIVLNDDNLDHLLKLKVSDAFLDGMGKVESQRQVIHYYTDVRIPPTTTLEEFFYQSWLKIQGLYGKANS
jgi:hypothetical protein